VKAGILFSHDQQRSKDLEQNRQEQSKPHRHSSGIRT
jgi:hypothetical protein